MILPDDRVDGPPVPGTPAPPAGAQVPEGNLHRVVAEIARRDPGRAALDCDGVLTSYGALDALAAGYARALAAAGVRRHAIVAVAMNRSVGFVAAVLGSLRIGATFLPMDTTVPWPRLTQILDDAAPAACVHDDHLAGRLAAWAPPSTRLVAAEAVTAEAPPSPLPPVDPPVAYCIFTSGSTGRPKGVLLGHAGLRTVIRAQRQCLGTGPDDRIAQFASPSFDAFVFETVMAWGAGGTLVLVPDAARTDASALLEFLDRREVTAAVLPSIMVAGLARLPAGAPRLAVVASAGDVLPVSAVRDWPHPARLVNLYGPTEATIWTTVQARVPAAMSVPIGVPIPAVDVHLLSPDLEPVPTGEPGEICIGGPVVGYGYLNRPAQTAGCFVPDPFGPPGRRMYRTGDLARRDSDGVIEFLGRLDRQVKVRGFRIEPGEIEAVLATHPEVADAVVLARGDGADRDLVGYVLTGPEQGGRPGSAAAAELRAHLAQRLPAHMVPARLHVLSAFPTTSSGKADRAALAAIDDAARDGTAPDATAPQTPEQVAVARIWCDTLGLSACDIDQPFQACGGHSLTATQLANRINRDLGARVTAIHVLDGGTIASLAARVPRRPQSVPATGPGAAARPASFPASMAQMQIAYANDVTGEPQAYVARARLTLHGPLDADALVDALHRIVDRHEIFRTRFEMRDGILTQVVVDPVEVSVARVDVGAGQDPQEHILAEMAAAVLDAGQPPLARWALLRYAADRHVLLHVEHHYVHDGWSFRVFLAELAALYSAAVTATPVRLPEPVQFGDYTRWQHEWLRSPQAGELSRRWRQMLHGAPPRLDLPALETVAPAQGPGRLHRVSLDAELMKSVHALAARLGATVFQVMFATFALLMSRLCGRDDLVVGSSAANRSRVEWEQVIGMVVNVVPVRVNAMRQTSVAGFLAAARRGLLAALDASELPFAHIVATAAASPGLQPHPVAQVLFNAHSALTSDVNFAGLRVQVQEALANTAAKFPLNVTLIPASGWTHGEALFEYDSGRFDGDRVDRLAAAYLDLLAAVARDVDRRVETVDPLIEARLPGATTRPGHLTRPDPTPADPGQPSGPPPTGRTETGLAAAWCDLLRVATVSRDADFFVDGGDAELAGRLAARAAREFDVELTAADVIAYPTLAGLARHIVDRQLASFDPDELAALRAALPAAGPTTQEN